MAARVSGLRLDQEKHTQADQYGGSDDEDPRECRPRFEGLNLMVAPML
ncbi:hypothetical protein LWC34_52970 [Kibdelosporangium philippinense]|uniref:Uncharacterized protein n=1 Tax=Kibdelosporangium philippinense TaxID=211113 RepID=A0ABS8ZXL0_9PSEU|nr:hypothetical protein [Kibdelosporangium philippinense]MCE7011471.1 hypothetical protein [Kibdelosporangium philippinense]